MSVCALSRSGSQETASQRQSAQVASALKVFDRERPNIELVLDLAGCGPAMVAMAQMGQEVFKMRLHPKRRTEIYEKVLASVLLARLNKVR